MSQQSSAISSRSIPISTAGVGWGLLGVLAFSFTIPMTRIAVGGFSPLFTGSARAVVAAALAAVALAVARQRLPSGGQRIRLLVVAGGVVIGFPFLTSFALQTAPAAHGAVVIGLLPAATAVATVLRTGERPRTAFWVLAALGAIAAVAFASAQYGGFGRFDWSDLLLFGAVVFAAVGYAEGGVLAREVGSWQTVCWALVLVSPAMIVLAVVGAGQRPLAAAPVEWLALAYLAVVSMFLGFFAWYRGLAIGPMAQVSQVQLVQPVFTIAWAGLLLHERIGAATVLGGLAVVLLAGLASRTRRTSRRV